MNPSPNSPFTSAHLRARIVKILLIIAAIAAGMSLLTEAVSLAFPPLTEEEELGENPMGAAIMLLMFLLGVLELMIYLTTVVFFSIWLYRAYDNLRLLNPTRPLNHSPGWAVGSFFVPFVNLVVPYTAVKEVWQKSGPPDEAIFSEPSPPASFPIWWFFWIIASIAGNISMRVAFNENVDEATVTTISIAASALFIIAAVFAYVVVDEIDKRQQEASGNLKLGGLSGPPPPPANLSMPDVVTATPGPSDAQQS